MKAGDAFYIRDRSVDTHLWVVISDPQKDPGRVIMVSVTTFEDYKEDVCPINAGDHPRVTHRSCVAYHEARMKTLERLIALPDGNYLFRNGLTSHPVDAWDYLMSDLKIGVNNLLYRI